MESLHTRLFPGLSIKIQRSNGESRVLRPRGRKSGENAKMVTRPQTTSFGTLFSPSHNEGFDVPALVVGVPYTEGNIALPGYGFFASFLGVGGAPLLYT